MTGKYDAMKSSIRKFDIESEYFFKEGCYITEVSNSHNDKEVSIARARVEPGKKTRWHALANTAERYVILEGTGTVEIGDLSPVSVAKGDVVLIPPQTRQRIFNSGKTDLIFLAICSPRFIQENYLALE